MNIGNLSHWFVCAVFLFAGIPATVTADEGDSRITQEYFVQQAAGEALLIRISAFEAEIESTIFGPSTEVLLVSGLAGSRIAPVFQYIHAPGKARQLDIELASTSYTDRSEFGIGLTRMAVWDDRSNAVARAYQ